MAGDRLEALERENRELTARLVELTAARPRAMTKCGARPRSGSWRCLGRTPLSQLIDLLQSGLRKSFRLDAVSLVLHDPQHEMRHLLIGEPASSGARGVVFVDSMISLAPQLANLECPWFGPFLEAEHAVLLLQSRLVASIALVPLRRGEQLDGVLVFGSRDVSRFTPGLASDYMEHLGIIAAICLENAVNRARLVRSGLTDFLTGFHNRRYMQARLREELARAQRDKATVACLMIDVDHFKRLNDAHGHLAGDTVLREVARRIDSQIRMSDTGARFGGDEFADGAAGRPRARCGSAGAPRAADRERHSDTGGARRDRHDYLVDRRGGGGSRVDNARSESAGGASGGGGRCGALQIQGGGAQLRDRLRHGRDLMGTARPQRART